MPNEDESQIISAYQNLPIYFEANNGQVDESVEFIASTNDYRLYLTPEQAIFGLGMYENNELAGIYGLFMRFEGATPHTTLIDEAQQEGVSNYFSGSEANWQTNIHHYGQICYQDLYNGIDAVFYGNPNNMLYDFIVEPHVDPSQIQISIDPADALSIDEDGNLVLDMGERDFIMQAPFSYQMVDGEQVPVASHFVLSDGLLSFGLGDYDASLPLVIDPTLIYAGYVGGAQLDTANGIAVDATGAAYIVGGTVTQESTFPVVTGPDLTYNGTFGGDAYIMKINSAGTAIVYAGYIGGNVITGNFLSGGDVGYDVAVDATGAAYVTGDTFSDESTFPITAGSFGTTFGGNRSGFVAKVNTAGTALDYAGYLAVGDLGRGIAVDATGAAYVTGNGSFVQKINPAGSAFVYTYTPTNDAQDIALTAANVACISGASGNDGFVECVNATGTGTVGSVATFGGSGTENVYGVAVDNAGNVYAVGRTNSNNFPTTAGAFDQTLAGNFDGFVISFPIGSTTPNYSTYLGGTSYDSVNGIAVDVNGNAYIAGNTSSTQASFPVLVGPDLTFNTGSNGDAFVALLDANGANLVYSGYIGGSQNDIANGIAIDSNNYAYVTGTTVSTEGSFPDGDGFGALTTFDSSYGGGFSDGFVAKVAFPLFVELSASTAAGLEGDTGTSAVTTPTLLVSGGITTSAVSIDIALADGTATLADSDYSQTTITVTIPAGNYSTVTPIAIPVDTLGIVGDTTPELDEDLTLTLQNPGGGAVIGDANADSTTISTSTYTIQNDDATILVEMSAVSGSGNEGDTGTNAVSTPTMIVSGGLLAVPRTVELALTDGTATLADNDYTQTTIIITIPAGDYTTPTAISIPVDALGIVGDTTIEPDEDLTLTLQNPSAGINIADANGDSTVIDTATYTIVNDGLDDTDDGGDSGDTTVASNNSNGNISVFDPGLSKIGVLVPGQVGVTGEVIEWIITVSNNGNGAGTNIVLTDTLVDNL